MTSRETIFALRTLLYTLGLSKSAVDELLDLAAIGLAEKQSGSRLPRSDYPYHVRDDFLSPAELRFYLVLKSAVSGWAVICPKVSLGDLFFANPGEAGQVRLYSSKIDRKHVDFLLCDLDTARPLMGIELDDKSHARPDRQERDRFVEQVFKAAQLPLARFPVKHAYTALEINAALLQQLEKKKPSAPRRRPAPVPAAGAGPACPKCGSEMVLRVWRSRANPDQKFWGCTQFPRCREMLKIEV